MKILILKKFWMFLLTLSFLIVSKVNTNADPLSLISSLTDEEVRIIHRALNNKCQVDWKKEFKLNTTNRKEKTRKVLDFLTAVYAMKMTKSERETLDCLQSFYAEESSEPDPIKLQFMKNRWREKQTKLELGKGQLEGLWRNSIRDDRETFECLTREPDDLDDFVILGSEPTIASQELKIGQPVVDIFTSASSSFSSSASSSSSSSVASSSTPPTSVSSTSLTDVSDEAGELLSMLDEKSAKIALQARLNNYQIPFAVFNFNVPEGAEKCMKVVNYLNSTLERKIRNVLDKQSKLSPESPEHQLYCKKHTRYQKISEDMWGSYMTNKASPLSFYSASSSRSKSRGSKTLK